MSADLILIWGPAFAGRGTLAARLGVRKDYDDPPAPILRHARQLEIDIQYRGSIYRPRLSEGHAQSIRRAAGVIFVADSQHERHLANLECLENFTKHLNDLGRNPADVPIVFALNKRDLPNAFRVPVLVSVLQWPCCDHVETIATTGVGVEATLDRLLSLIDERRAVLAQRR